jgi:transcriptional regulator GlxA family with amidase domain
MQNKRIKAICRWIRENYQRGREIACTCTGTFLLVETGLLDGRTATTNWLFADSFKRQYPKVNLRIERIFTEDAGLHCTGAATAFMNLCLHLIEKFGSSDLASRCAKALLVDTDRHTQSPYAIHDFRSFRRLFTKHTGLSPKHYRNKFSRQSRDA